MTKKQLEKIGVFKDNNKLYPSRYWSNIAECYINIYKNDTLEDVVKAIYEQGIEQGIKEGKEIRSNQIRGLLHNVDLF